MPYRQPPVGECDEFCLNSKLITTRTKQIGHDPSSVEDRTTTFYAELNSCLGKKGCQAAILTGKQEEDVPVPDLGVI